MRAVGVTHTPAPTGSQRILRRRPRAARPPRAARASTERRARPRRPRRRRRAGTRMIVTRHDREAGAAEHDRRARGGTDGVDQRLVVVDVRRVLRVGRGVEVAQRDADGIGREVAQRRGERRRTDSPRKQQVEASSTVCPCSLRHRRHVGRADRKHGVRQLLRVGGDEENAHGTSRAAASVSPLAQRGGGAQDFGVALSGRPSPGR